MQYKTVIREDAKTPFHHASIKLERDFKQLKNENIALSLRNIMQQQISKLQPITKGAIISQVRARAD
jgi:hypothetical protein